MGAPTPDGGDTNLLFSLIFSRKLLENLKKCTERGVPGADPGCPVTGVC